MAATAIALLVLGGAAEQARVVCATLAEVRATNAAVSAARNALDQALATPCASLQSAAAGCGPSLDCTITGRELGRRTEAGSTLILTHLAVEVREHGAAPDAHALARLVTVGARPAVCT